MGNLSSPNEGYMNMMMMIMIMTMIMIMIIMTYSLENGPLIVDLAIKDGDVP
jgi:hypothetical protein